MPKRNIKNKELVDLFPKAIFWDVALEKLSIKDDKDFIIQRVLSWHMDNEERLENLEKLYAIEDIKHYALKSNEIFGNEAIEFLAKRYNLEPSQFQKYILSLS